MTQDSGQMMIAYYTYHSSVMKQVMHLIFSLLLYITWAYSVEVDVIWKCNPFKMNTLIIASRHGGVALN